MKLEGNEIVFSTGKRRYCYKGRLGLSIDGQLDVGYGSDGGFWTPDETLFVDESLTQDELREMADHMIKMWTEFRAKVVPCKHEHTSISAGGSSRECNQCGMTGLPL